MKKLFRSRKNKMISGVLGGLGDYFRIDPTILRLIFIFLTIVTAIIPLLLAYFIASLIIPFEPRGTPALAHKKLYRSTKNKKIAGICGGLANLFHLDPTLVRLITIFLCFLTGFFPICIAYVIGWIIIPENPF